MNKLPCYNLECFQSKTRIFPAPKNFVKVILLFIKDTSFQIFILYETSFATKTIIILFTCFYCYKIR